MSLGRQEGDYEKNDKGRGVGVVGETTLDLSDCGDVLKSTMRYSLLENSDAKMAAKNEIAVFSLKTGRAMRSRPVRSSFLLIR